MVAVQPRNRVGQRRGDVYAADAVDDTGTLRCGDKVAVRRYEVHLDVLRLEPVEKLGQDVDRGEVEVMLDLRIEHLRGDGGTVARTRSLTASRLEVALA